jgi:serine/threonine-protein kinase
VGRVFQVRDLGLGRVVALKVLRSGPGAGSEEVARFHREARMAAQLDHPHLMPVYSIGLFQGQYAITMPYLGGGNLLQHRAKYRDVRSAVVLMLKVCRAVAVAHRAGIVHRDLKPGNILLDEAGEPMVSDFGLARFTDSDSEMTRPGQVLGTPGYMSPEQAGGRGLEVGPASDVWSLGVILYLLLTGRKPFEAADSWQLFQKLRWSNPSPPRSLRQELPGDLETVVLKCLEKAPRDRYASAEQLADDLEHWLRGEPVSASRPRFRWLRPGGRSWPLVAGGVLGILLLALGMVLFPGQTRNAVAMSRPHSTPEVPAREQQLLLLRQQQPVTLLGPTGKPAVSRWIDESGRFAPPPSSETPLNWDAFDWTMLELMHEVPLKRYQISAQVLHRDSGEDSLVGLFFLHRQARTNQGDEHFLMYCGINDRHPMATPFSLHVGGYRTNPPKGKWRDHYMAAWKRLPKKLPAAVATLGVTGAQPQSATPWTLALHIARLGIVDRPAPPIPPQKGPAGNWHTIVVDVTPEKIRATLDHELVLETRCAVLEKQARMLLQHRNVAIPEPFVAGDLGLLVYNGAASFRNVVLTPLPEE